MVEDKDTVVSERFAFVIPVVNPNSAKISSYQTVESVLRETVQSLLQQTYGDTIVVVVCHRIPEWAASLSDRVRFLDVGDHVTFLPNRNHVRIDKRMKYAIGSLQAIAVDDARFVMLSDADDSVRRDLAEMVRRSHTGRPESDGFLITRGVHAQIDWSRQWPAIEGTFEVVRFNKTCGSCRVFDAGSLLAALQTLDQGFMDFACDLGTPDSRGVTTPSSALLDHIDRLTDPIRHDERGIVRVLGRHTRQRDFFRFTILDEPLAAKGCGHRNHDGRRHGEVHWKRITGFVNPQKFIDDFGLASNGRFDVDIDLAAKALASAGLVFRRTIGWVGDFEPGRKKY